MPDCIFCSVVTGVAEASMVYQDELISAFMDVQPVNPGHVLIVPNAHASGLADLPAETGGRIFRVGQRVAAALRSSGIRCEGVNLFLADGEAAMQEVLHVHLHVFPRYRGDEFGLTFSSDYSVKPSRSQLEGVASKIRERL